MLQNDRLEEDLELALNYSMKGLEKPWIFYVFWCRNPERTDIIRDAATSVIDLTAALTRSAASAWWGYAHASDRSRLEAVLRRGKRSGSCSGDVTTTADLVGRAGTFAVSWVVGCWWGLAAMVAVWGVRFRK